MIIKIGSAKYGYDVDVHFETREINDVEIEWYGNQKITTPTKTLKIVGWSYNTEAFSKEQVNEIELHLKEYLMDIEDLLN